jgi:hypothetical protein
MLPSEELIGEFSALGGREPQRRGTRLAAEQLAFLGFELRVAESPCIA